MSDSKNAPGVVSLPQHAGFSETSATKTLRVLLIDDSPDICDMMCTLTRGTSDIELTSLTSTRDLLRIVDMWNPKIVLMDLTIPGETPLEATRLLRGVRPEVRTIAFSGHDDDDTLDSVYEAGGWGLIGKSMKIDGVLDTIRRVAGL